jgi:hypothetical protein
MAKKSSSSSLLVTVVSAFAPAAKCDPHLPGAAATRVAVEELAQADRIPQAQNLGLVDRTLHLAAARDGGEVEDGAGDGRDRDAFAHGDFVIRQTRFVEVDSGSPPLHRCADLDLQPRALPQSPQRRGIPVAQHGTLSAGEHGGHPMATTDG